MSDDSIIPLKQPAAPDPGPEPQFMKEFAGAISKWAESSSAGKTDDAEATARQILSLVQEEEQKNPSPSVRLANEADELESQGDWLGAEAARRQVLELAEASGNFGRIAKARMDLCVLLQVVGRLTEAWRFAEAATAAGRQWPNNFALLAMMLRSQAACALSRKDLAGAFAAAHEAVEIIEPGRMSDNTRARSLAVRAKCLLAQGDVAGAGADLATAWDLIKTNTESSLLPGARWTHANWHEVKSQLERQLGNHERAREAISQAMGHFRLLCETQSRLALARALYQLGALCRAAGDEVGEERCRSEANSLREELKLPVSDK